MSSTSDGYLSQEMSAVSDLSMMRDLASSLERSEVRRSGGSRGEARNRIAGRIGISPGTLENIRRERTKIVPNWLMARIRAELMSALTSEMRKLQHEIDLYRQVGMDHRDDALCAAETQLAAARALLEAK